MITIDQIVLDWAARMEPVVTARTAATNRAPVEYLANFFKGKRVEEIDRAGIEWLRNALLAEGKSKVTVARYLSVLRAALGRALPRTFEIGKMISELKRNGTKEVKVWSREHSRDLITAALTVSEVTNFASVLDFLFGTGARRGEALALHWDDVDFKRKRIHLRHALTLDGKVQDGTKWGGRRFVPMADSIATILKALPVVGCSPFVFPYPDGFLWDQNRFHHVWKAVRYQAFSVYGVPQYKLHTTRHTAISRALTAGMSLRKASEIFGVSQQTLESHYAHFIEEEVNMDWVGG